MMAAIISLTELTCLSMTAAAFPGIHETFWGKPCIQPCIPTLPALYPSSPSPVSTSLSLVSLLSQPCDPPLSALYPSCSTCLSPVSTSLSLVSGLSFLISLEIFLNFRRKYFSEIYIGISVRFCYSLCEAIQIQICSRGPWPYKYCNLDF